MFKQSPQTSSRRFSLFKFTSVHIFFIMHLAQSWLFFSVEENYFKRARGASSHPSMDILSKGKSASATLMGADLNETAGDRSLVGERSLLGERSLFATSFRGQQQRESPSTGKVHSPIVRPAFMNSQLNTSIGE